MSRYKLTRCPLPVLFLCLLAQTRGDSIDEAEAKRRGVPVAQVLAENALAAEKRKNADLEKRVADLEKKIAELSGQPTTTAAPPSASTSSPLNFDGPRSASPLYDDFVNRYLAGDWRTLAADLAAKEKEIAALPAGNAADIAYIKQALAECRPPWWDQVKAGRPVQFRQMIWKQSATINYEPSPAPRFIGGTTVNGALVYRLGWPADHMDARDPMDLADVGLQAPGADVFARADGMDQSIWNMIGGAAAITQVGAAKVRTFSPDEKQQFDRFSAYFQNIASAYYSTPPARRLVYLQSLASFEPLNDSRPDWAGRRPVGAAILIELAQHPERYKTIKIEPILGLDQVAPAGMSVEMFVAKPVVVQLAAAKLTFAEDRLLREMIKTVATSSTSWNVSKVVLPNKLAFDLNPANDAPLAAERVAFISSHMPH